MYGVPDSRVRTTRLMMWLTGCFLLLGHARLAATQETDRRPLVRICATMPMSGDISFYGLGFRDSALMALDGLAHGKYRYSLVLEDDQASAAKAVSAFRKLTTVDGCAIVFSATANIGLAIAPLARQKDILHLGISSDPAFADGTQNFNIWPAPEIPARKLVQEFTRRKLSRIALIGMEHAWPRAVFEKLTALLAENGLTVTMQDHFVPGERNMRPLLEKLRASNSDIAVLLSWSPELEIFARQYHELRLTVPLTSEFAFESSTDPKLFDGFWFVNMKSSTPDYHERFKARYGYTPYAQMELGDLMTKLIVGACEHSGDGVSVPTRAEMAQYLRSVKDQPSVIGPISIRADGILKAPYVLKMVKNGVVEEPKE